jgi:hypothetical protein
MRGILKMFSKNLSLFHYFEAFFAVFLLLFLATLGWISLDLGLMSSYRRIVTDLM